MALNSCMNKKPQLIDLDGDGYLDQVSYLNNTETDELHVRVAWGLSEGGVLPAETVAVLEPSSLNIKACDFTLIEDQDLMVLQYPKWDDDKKHMLYENKGIPFFVYAESRLESVVDRELQSYQGQLNDLAKSILFGAEEPEGLSENEARIYDGSFQVVVTVRGHDIDFRVSADFLRLDSAYNEYLRESMFEELVTTGFSSQIPDGTYVFKTHIQFDEDQQVFVYSTEIVDPILY